MIKLILATIIFSLNSYALTIPIISYSESSGTTYGGFTQFKLDKEQDTNLLLYLVTNDNGQSGFIRASNVPFKTEKLNIFFYGSNSARSYNGIANYSTTDISSLYYDQLNLRITMEREFYRNWDLILGLNYKYYNENNSKNNRSTAIFKELYDFGGIVGFQMDKRDREYNTSQGYFNEIKALVFDNYQILSNDIRLFKPFYNGTLAFKLYSAQTFTNHEHFSYYQKAGSYYYLRGYSSNQILDKHISYAQIEWRKSLFNWPVITPFLEVGTLGSSPTNLKKSFFSYGLGLYIPIGNGRLRIEKAYSDNKDKFYFGFNHVF